MRTLAKIFGLSVYGVCAGLILLFILPAGGWKALNVLTGSMRPAIMPGDLVLVHRVPLNKIRVGDVVTYTNPANPSQTITHRVIARERRGQVQYVTTKGDANSGPDRAFPGGRIVGKVVATIPAVGRITHWLRSPLALAAIVIIPGLFVIWSEIRLLRRRLAVVPKIPAALSTDTVAPGPPGAKISAQAQPVRAARSKPRKRIVHLSLLLGAGLILTVGITYAAPDNVVSLTGNTLSARRGAVTPSPAPTPRPAITPCPGTNTNNVQVTNANQQTATSAGSVAATNSNDTQTTVIIRNCQS